MAEHQSVLDNVADGLLYAGVALGERRAQAYEAATPGRSRSPRAARPTQLSGGERQRIAIALVLVGRPAIVLADEPTGNLDSTNSQAILELLDALHEGGATILVITHRARHRGPVATPDRAARRSHRRRLRPGGSRRIAERAARSAGRPRREVPPPEGEVRRHGGELTAHARAAPALDLSRVALVGIRTRKLRAALSALGIAIGVAAIVAVLGLSASSESGLLAEINALGTNLLTVTNGQTLFGQTAELPQVAPAMIGRIGPVSDVQDTGAVTANVFRSPLIPSIDTNALSVDAASLGLPRAVGTTVAQGSFLNAATATEPVCVLGAAAAQRLGIDRVYPGERIWLNDMWFYVAGILNAAPLTPEIDSEVLVGYKAAEKYLASTATRARST